MIENFLLDPDALWEAIQSVVEKTPFRSVGDLKSALDALLNEAEEAEVERRAIVSLGVQKNFRPSSVETISSELEAFITGLQNRYSDDNRKTSIEQAKQKVDYIRSLCRRREEFEGKAILKNFHKRYLHNTGLARDVFIYLTAYHARHRKAVKTFFDEFFDKLLSASVKVKV